MTASKLKAGAALSACVLPILWFAVVRPQLPSAIELDPGAFRIPGYLPGDCPYYRAAMDSLLHDADLDVRNNAPWTALPALGNVAVARDGAWVPKHPILLPVLALPLYALAGDPGLLGFNLLQLLLLDVVVLWLAMRYSQPRIAFGTAMVFALGTLLRPLAFNFSPDVLSTLLVAGAFLAFLGSRVVLAGFLLGASVAAKWTNVVFFLPLAVAAVSARGWRGAALMVSAAAPWLVALAALNWHWFGSPLVTPYDRVLIETVGGIDVVDPSMHRGAFDQPFWRGLWIQTTDPQRGLVVSAPPVLLALPGFAVLSRYSRRDAWLLAGGAALQLAVFAPYRYWSASVAGHRFLLTAIVLCAPAVACGLQYLADATPRLLRLRSHGA
jgi:hypothetical protein